MNDLREWLVSLVEGMPDERLLQIADAVEDAALTKDGSSVLLQREYDAPEKICGAFREYGQG